MAKTETNKKNHHKNQDMKYLLQALRQRRMQNCIFWTDTTQKGLTWKYSYRSVIFFFFSVRKFWKGKFLPLTLFDSQVGTWQVSAALAATPSLCRRMSCPWDIPGSTGIPLTHEKVEFQSPAVLLHQSMLLPLRKLILPGRCCTSQAKPSHYWCVEWCSHPTFGWLLADTPVIHKPATEHSTILTDCQLTLLPQTSSSLEQ